VLTFALITLTAIAGLGFWLWRQIRRGMLIKPAGITILLKEPRSLNLHVLSHQLSSVTGCPVRMGRRRKDDDDGEDFISGGPRHYVAFLGGATFTIANWSTPYLEDPVAASAVFAEPHLKNAIKEHRAWLSMDVVPAQISPGAYRQIARIVAQWMGADCLALYHAPLDRYVACFGDATVEALLTDDPIRSVFDADAESA
jgi:hypothetical protein